MKLNVFLLLLLSTLLFNNVNAQNFKGVWISAYEKAEIIYQEYPVVEDETEEMEELQPVGKVSIPYKPAYGIMDFINDKQVVVKGIGGKQLTGTYTVKKGYLKIKVGKEKAVGRISEDTIELMESKKKSKGMIVFKRLTVSDSENLCKLDSTCFNHSNWIMQTDTSSLSYGYNFHFSDSTSLVISQFAKNVSSNNGRWKTDRYKNHLFLNIYNTHTMGNSLYHFYGKDDNALVGDNYEFELFPENPPALKQIELKQVDFLTPQEKDQEKGKLVGEWKAYNNPIPSDSWYEDADTLLNQHFDLTFKNDDTFSIHMSATRVGGDNRKTLTSNTEGTWKLSDTGKYIIIKPNDSYECYMTIVKMEGNNLEVFYEVNALDGYGISNQKIQMKK